MNRFLVIIADPQSTKCPRCGHQGKLKPDMCFRCYNKNCPVGYYDDKTGQTESKLWIPIKKDVFCVTCAKTIPHTMIGNNAECDVCYGVISRES